MKCVRPPESLPKKVKYPIQIDTYIFVLAKYLGESYIHRMGTEERFQVDVSAERLHIIHVTLNNCIGFSEIEHPSENKSNKLEVR